MQITQIKQKKLSPDDLDQELMALINEYVATVEHPSSFYVLAKDALMNQELLPGEYCVIVALPGHKASDFPATAASNSAIVITTRNGRMAALELRDKTIALPDHAFRAWQFEIGTRILVIYQFTDVTILEDVPFTESLATDLWACSMSAQSKSHPTYADLYGTSADLSEIGPVLVLDNRDIYTQET
ncbi:hypothetical protein [Paraburkholderia sp. GAS42]|uniref:hypothetical protein n=1 Tax=Paraburkholderia sp. GAS42 TaxID=3035135 RepID=UPI003D1D7025